MGNLKACFVVATLALAACGSDHKANPDAPVHMIDAAPDAKPIDAPPDAPAYDFTCYGMANPTTAADPITASGTTETLSQSGVMTLSGVTVDTYKTGTTNPVDQQTSGTGGAFTTGNITTGGLPFDGFIKAALASYRTTYLYPPNPLVASLTMVPVIVLSTSNFALLGTVSGQTQDDTNNGFLLVTATDCASTPVAGATISVKQNGTDVGTQFDLGALAAQAQGVVAVYNVPDGATDVSATYMGMNFPAHTVMAHKKPNGANAVGTITLTAVRPGP